ncbi:MULTISPECIES: DUF6148 family protein [Streptobacillus]|uniref:DUF6148 family protein n=1 Tax=Streptobacillus TaxID=34104 RepID=UPI0007E305BA|nr:MULTISPECIES: DUF6148 family protein [Streptobacillus]
MEHYNKEICQEMINMYIEAEKAVLTGQRYRIGSRELERANLSEIVKNRMIWERRLVDLNTGGGSTIKRKKIRGIIPRDL